jgi:hypothetical protein
VTYTVTFTVRADPSTAIRTITTNFAGCVDADDARAKCRRNYPGVVAIKTVAEKTKA